MITKSIAMKLTRMSVACKIAAISGFLLFAAFFAGIVFLGRLFFSGDAANTAANTANEYFGQVCVGKKCFMAELALTEEEQERGLMFRQSLGWNEGMLFIFKHPGVHKFWMKNTLIPLDIVWIGQDSRIIYISGQTAPCLNNPCPDYGPMAPAKYVFEANAGQMALLGAKIGDEVAISLP